MKTTLEIFKEITKIHAEEFPPTVEGVNLLLERLLERKHLLIDSSAFNGDEVDMYYSLKDSIEKLSGLGVGAKSDSVFKITSVSNDVHLQCLLVLFFKNKPPTIYLPLSEYSRILGQR